jgi:hypothetical protein
VGVQSRPELNGRLVRVGKLVEATGRFRVLVPASEVPAVGGRAILTRRCISHLRFSIQKQTCERGNECTARWLARGDRRGANKLEASEPRPGRRRTGLATSGGEVISRLTEFSSSIVHIVGLNTRPGSYFVKSEIIARSCAP